MDNEEKLKKELKNQPANSLKPKLKPEPRYEQLKNLLKSAKEKVLNSINNIVNYALDNFQELYNETTNSQSKNKDAISSNFKNEPVALDENFVAQELIAKAKQDGDTKEVFLNNQHPSNENMVGSSLVLDMDTNKIDATIKDLAQKLNEAPNSSIESVANPEPLVDNEPKNEINATSNVKKNNKKELKGEPKAAPLYPAPASKLESIAPTPSSNLKPPSNVPSSKLKPIAPKPTPNGKSKKDARLEVKIPTPINIEATIESMRNKFLLNQENNPSVLEQQNYETVLRPQDNVFILRNKDTVFGHVSAIKNSMTSEYIPDSVEDKFGVEQRKIKARLK